jgi:hypothetical protein
MTQPGFRIEPISIVRRAPPAVSHSLVSSNPRRTKQFSSLSRSTNERRSPESCSSFRSSEETHAGFATVALGGLRRARLGVLPVGSSRAPVVARVGVVGPTRATRQSVRLIRLCLRRQRRRPSLPRGTTVPDPSISTRRRPCLRKPGSWEMTADLEQPRRGEEGVRPAEGAFQVLRLFLPDHQS